MPHQLSVQSLDVCDRSQNVSVSEFASKKASHEVLIYIKMFSLGVASASEWRQFNYHLS